MKKDSVLNVLRSWLGRNENDNSHRQIIDIYNGIKPLPRGYAVKYTDEWCDAGLSAAFIQAGDPNLIGRECGCEKHIDIFKNKGIWIEDGTVTPQSGDIIVFSWRKNTQPNNSYADHIGIVESVSGRTITTIECNKSNAVSRRTIQVGHGNIRGYARPKYESSTAQTPNPSVINDVIAGKYGNNPERSDRLRAAGYDPQVVQQLVNQAMKYEKKPNLDQVVREVCLGKWGNGADRVKRLRDAGYDPQTVQQAVNNYIRSLA